MDTLTEIKINDIWQHNVSFLIGSGASYGLFPTLATKMDGESIETLGKYFEDENKLNLKSLLFMYYYISCIKPVITYDIEVSKLSEGLSDIEDLHLGVISSYKELLNTLKTIASKNKSQKKINIFTTNYDACFTDAYEELLLEQPNLEFVLNDGAKGFRRKFLEVRNFDTSEVKHSIFGKNQFDIPQVNLVHLHGSAFWTIDKNRIAVNYYQKECKFRTDFFDEVKIEIEALNTIIQNESSVRSNFDGIQFGKKFSNLAEEFWKIYNTLPIVNPTKWKFHETVFDEHYYQMLRLMSYELEKQDSVLVVFGFSFADEHITNLVKRSLGNKSLTMYLCCFNDTDYNSVLELFREFNNVKLVKINGLLDFNTFNTDVFHLPT
ncbi:MAG: SIR2 family protein [Gammaproteobacteria bacterium]|nr:SIR2 family protein [Gammaproteobacteria bacterium]MBU1466828.1 SIR2 family protein [Gammaproteobacteria bacterium]MBU2023988.1 SIR2 family protein [Gammaproteobacteria bacterium]MBU2239156.1 SIR2 family protein [Gammaproteobacteria bacterium]MBU2319033.1 SIR2 family protein [Gammaproteobacteria bacterium]